MCFKNRFGLKTDFLLRSGEDILANVLVDDLAVAVWEQQRLLRQFKLLTRTCISSRRSRDSITSLSVGSNMIFVTSFACSCYVSSAFGLLIQSSKEANSAVAPLERFINAVDVFTLALLVISAVTIAFACWLALRSATESSRSHYSDQEKRHSHFRSNRQSSKRGTHTSAR